MITAAEKTGSVYDMKAVHFALDLIELFLETKGHLSLAGFSRRLASPNINKVFRVLTTLEARNFICKNVKGEYMLGAGAFNMARGILNVGLMKENYIPVLQELADTTHESAYIGTVSQGEVVLRDMIDGDQKVRVASCIGCSYRPSGEALAATSNQNENISRIYIDHDCVRPDVTSMTVLINLPDGMPSAVLALLVPNHRAQLEVFVPQILAGAARLSRLTGMDTGQTGTRKQQDNQAPDSFSHQYYLNSKAGAFIDCCKPYGKAEVNHGRATV